MKPGNLLVYRSQVLPISQTFVFNQSMFLYRYKAYILGSKKSRETSMILPPGRVALVNEGGIKGIIWELLFKLFGILPSTIKHWLNQVNPQLIHAHFGPDGAYILPLAKKLHLPLLVSFLGTDVTLNEKIAKKTYISFKFYYHRKFDLINYVTAVVVPSEFVKQHVIKHGFPENKIKLIHHGVDISKFSNELCKPIWGNILFVGRLIPLKGLDYLINGIQLLREEGLNIILTVIGDGECRDFYDKMANQKLGSGYEFLGSQPQEMVIKEMSKAHILCVPSVTMPDGTAETFGMVFVEAQAMGVPVVSFDIGGISEVVENGVTGILVQEKNVNDLANALKKVLTEPNLRNKMSVAARERAVHMFDLRKQNAELECLYDNILNKNLHNEPIL